MFGGVWFDGREIRLTGRGVWLCAPSLDKHLIVVLLHWVGWIPQVGGSLQYDWNRVEEGWVLVEGFLVLQVWLEGPLRIKYLCLPPWIGTWGDWICGWCCWIVDPRCSRRTPRCSTGNYHYQLLAVSSTRDFCLAENFSESHCLFDPVLSYKNYSQWTSNYKK